MDELVKMVSEKTGISESQAEQAVQVVMGYLKDKLPAPVAAQLDSVMGGGGNGMESLKKGLGGLFSK